MQVDHPDYSFIKIGITSDPSCRNRTYDLKSHLQCEVKILSKVEDELYGCYLLEQHLHKMFCSDRFKPAKQFEGHTECFTMRTKNALLHLFEQL